MLSVDSLPVAEEEVVESTSNKWEDIYTFLAEGCFPPTMGPVRKKNLKRYAQKFILEDGRLYYVGQKKEEKREVVIDPERKRQIFLECHFNDIGHHLGQKKTVHRIQSRYYWLGIVRDVVDWIKVCETCQNAEHNKSLSRKLRPIKVEAPWEILIIDLMGPFPETSKENTFLLLLTDYFSKWVEAIPLPKKEPLSVARCLSSAFYRFGAAKTVFCCQSREFCEEVTKHLIERWNFILKISPIEQPQQTSLYDRSTDMLKEALRQVMTEKQADWDDHLDPVLFVFRTSVNATTKFTPFFLMFNREASYPAEIEFDSGKEEQVQDMPVCSVKQDIAIEFAAAIQEQQNAVKQMVIANMNAAYKEEKKSSKRRARSLPSLTFKVDHSLLGVSDSAQLKRLKKNHYISFPAETVLAPDQCGTGGK
ncbi:gypsy retrotransposon integrase-like protein 1 isoform X1 [Erpetoichthys calabaricus]|uniref:Gypsy retrotransposon integrase-like protein 1 n=1 Tax=Erpetoichthys calabaricus TaxID=27687 RepID=A0A8C4TG85_ERPCA|nr:gypsy retrotransposon integrase-like protein 1 isoform X1 [Erpetoichthys calabaricus]